MTDVDANVQVYTRAVVIMCIGRFLWYKSLMVGKWWRGYWVDENFRGVTLSWMGRISSVKMLVLPKILYYFRTLPILVPIEANIFNFIWGAKGSRLAWTTMYAPRDLGGLGVADF